MAAFRSRISRAARAGGPVILACDYESEADPAASAVRAIRLLHPALCGIKLNFHLLLPLGAAQVRRITDAAHGHGLQAVADIKLNDIGNTNRVAAGHLWDMGFDAVIANPIMGRDALAALVRSAHGKGRGVISLCHMSAPEAREAYETRTGPSGRRELYRLFLDWALRAGADGIIVGATFPGIIRYCSGRARGRLGVYSPGVGAQGGDAGAAASAGTDYVIVGRSLLSSGDPVAAARQMASGFR